MALVSYDYDSVSDREDEDNEEASACVVIPQNLSNGQQSNSITEGVNSIEDDDPGPSTANSSLFSKLPETKPAINQVPEEDAIEDFIPKSNPKKEKPKVKITIPSLSQFDSLDDDEPQTKKAKTSAKGSSLLSLLPPVRGSVLTAKSFVPNVVAKKVTTTSMVPHAVKRKAEISKQAAIKKLNKIKQQTGSDLESDDDDIEIPDTYDDKMWEKVCGRPKPKEIIKEPEEAPPMEIINIAPEPTKPYDGLDNSAFKELVGKSRRPIGKIKLIDLNEEEILPEKDVWMTRALTDPEMEPKPEIKDPVDPTKKKKHHITYLAEQAKANEQEFKNQWSASKNNRLQTRAKYGF